MPKVTSGRAPVLLIHGGGWNALAKEDFARWAASFLQDGRPVFNINYRLLDEAPWPACGDDCLAAAEFIFAGGLSTHGLPAPQRLTTCGGSAGAHLAMMTGLRLPQKKVEGMISIAGPARMDWLITHHDPHGLHDGLLERFFGETIALDSARAMQASPALVVPSNPAPLFCLHSANDALVEPRHSQEMVTLCEGNGGRAWMLPFDGAGNAHGFWVDDDKERGVYNPACVEFMRRVIAELSVEN
jgi:acetyl esterase/lipase